MTRIVVEGMDGSGKTTLVNRLMANFPQLQFIRNEKGPDQGFDDWWVQQLLVEPAIHDRFFYSELVYGRILRGRINAKPATVQDVSWKLRLDAMLIYARPSTDQLRQGIKVEPQMEGVEDRFTDLLELYDSLMLSEKTWYGARFLQYTWELDEFQLLERVAGYLNGDVR